MDPPNTGSLTNSRVSTMCSPLTNRPSSSESNRVTIQIFLSATTNTSRDECRRVSSGADLKLPIRRWFEVGEAEDVGALDDCCDT